MNSAVVVKVNDSEEHVVFLAVLVKESIGRAWENSLNGLVGC